MNTYKYANGVIEPVELPDLTPELTLTAVGQSSAHEARDYAWHCCLPSEAMSAGMGAGFNITIYRAVSERAPYPYMALVDLGDYPGEIYFADLPDVIQYAREHAQLLQVTVLAGIADRIDEAMKWLFDSESGLFRDHVHEVYARERRAAEARRRARSAAPAVAAGKTPAA